MTRRAQQKQKIFTIDIEKEIRSGEYFEYFNEIPWVKTECQSIHAYKTIRFRTHWRNLIGFSFIFCFPKSYNRNYARAAADDNTTPRLQPLCTART